MPNGRNQVGSHQPRTQRQYVPPTRHQDPKQHNRNLHRRENLKSQLQKTSLKARTWLHWQRSQGGGSIFVTLRVNLAQVCTCNSTYETKFEKINTALCRKQSKSNFNVGTETIVLRNGQNCHSTFGLSQQTKRRPRSLG
jgi:hypothetical protein